MPALLSRFWKASFGDYTTFFGEKSIEKQEKM